MDKFVTTYLESLGEKSKESFKLGRHILSFDDYLKEAAGKPKLHLRDAAIYIRDMFDHYGTREVHYPWAKKTRFKLFDQPFGSARDALAGQEEPQEAFYDLLQSFVREGRPHKLIILHGPNGSSKSTFVKCIARALEHYSSTEEGTQYSFNWIFPSEGLQTSGLGFLKGDKSKHSSAGSYALLNESDIDSKLPCELKDHPLLLLPRAQREQFITEILEKDGGAAPVPELLRKGGVCPKCRLIFDALLAAYRGDLKKVFNHVQAERFFFSRRYRRGFASIGPQMSVDAGERQVTADRSLNALPKALQNISLFEPFGDLVDGSGGLIEFSDLLKRPVEAFKYLLETIESSEVQAGHSIQRINAVLVATTNEIHINAFKQHAEGVSFLGRMSLIKMPYIMHEPVESRIYENQVAPGVGKHVAPHAIEIASSWAIMSRLFKPDPERYDDKMKPLVKDLLATEKFDVYCEGKIPSRFNSEETKIFSNNIENLYHETDVQPAYEGVTGPSPREVKYILYLAAQNPDHQCLSPVAVIDELSRFVKRTKDYGFLGIEKEDGHYHEFSYYVDALKIRLGRMLMLEAVEASNIFTTKQLEELWSRYVLHASMWIKEEKVFNPVTRKQDPPDESLMHEVESNLDVKDKKEFRQEMLSRIAAVAIEKDRNAENTRDALEKIDPVTIFHSHIETLRIKMIKKNIPKLRRLVEEALALLSTKKEDAEASDEARTFLDNFRQQHGYCPDCATTALAFLMKEKLQ